MRIYGFGYIFLVLLLSPQAWTESYSENMDSSLSGERIKGILNGLHMLAVGSRALDCDQIVNTPLADPFWKFASSVTHLVDSFFDRETPGEKRPLESISIFEAKKLLERCDELLKMAEYYENTALQKYEMAHDGSKDGTEKDDLILVAVLYYEKASAAIRRVLSAHDGRFAVLVKTIKHDINYNKNQRYRIKRRIDGLRKDEGRMIGVAVAAYGGGLVTGVMYMMGTFFTGPVVPGLLLGGGYLAGESASAYDRKHARAYNELYSVDDDIREGKETLADIETQKDKAQDILETELKPLRDHLHQALAVMKKKRETKEQATNHDIEIW